MSKKAIIGDVFELHFEGGFIYLQYIGDYADHGEVIRVALPASSDARDVSHELFGSTFTTAYPLRAAIRARLVARVGNLESPPVPTRWMRPAYTDGAGHSHTWFIRDEGGDVLKESLSPEEQALPHLCIMNHQAIIEEVLRREGRSAATDNRPSDAMDPYPASGSIRHYLYFRRLIDARAAVRALRNAGFETSRSRSADGENWLVLAQRDNAGASHDVDADTEILQTVAERHNGEYDGSESAV